MQNLQPTILVVEDSPSARQLLDKVFEDNGCRLLHAIGVNDSKRFIDAERVDLAVVDYWLPDGEGSEVIKYLQARRPGAQALIVTAMGNDSRVNEMIKEGALAHVKKPFDVDALREQARRALMLARLARENEALQSHLESYTEELQTRDREFEAIRRLTSLTSEFDEFSNVGKKALDIVSGLLGEEAALAYFFVQASGQELILRHHSGLSVEERLSLSGLSPGEGLVGRALAGRRLAVSEDLDALPVGHCAATGEPVSLGSARRAVALPVFSKNQPVGALVACFAAAGPCEAARKFLSGSVGRFFAVAMENAFLSEMATVDSLTGLYNRGYFDARFQQEVSRASRYGHELTIILADLDSFKALNDTYGHLAGDAALREVSQFWKLGLRMADFAARYGGEELVLILPETSAEGATRVAEKIRAAVEKLRFHPTEGVPKAIPGVTVSVGIASYPADASSAKTLLKAADDALYEAKRQGGNRVVCCGAVSKDRSSSSA